MSKILIVEDDRDIAKNLALLLQDEGFAVSTAASRQGAQALFAEGFDLILLDLMLPDGSGYSLCAQIKDQGETPVIMLTAMDDEASVVAGFELGADDYITKPFRPRELVSRIKNVLRRKGKVQSVFQLGDVRVDTVKAIVTKNGAEVFLSALEYRLLLACLGKKGQVISRARLLEELWDASGDFVNDNTLTVYIGRLRNKIETDPQNPTLLKTARGLGYKVGD